jgi:filamentous hemagglutinin family protein
MIQIARFTRQQARYLSRTAKKSIRAGLQHWLHPLLFAMCTGLSGVPAAHAQAGNVLPTGMTVINGQVNAVQNGKNLSLSTSDKSVLNWQSFSVGAQNGVVFQQPSASSQVLNRVVGQDPSSILGSLQSNGKVWLLNPNGVLFGKDARIDVGGLVASSLHLDTADFLASRYLLKTAAGGSGTVVNQGQITTPYGGQVMLVGSDVQNTGSITTPGGHTGLLAGSLVELTDTATPFMSVRVPVKAGQVLQSGSVSAERIDIHGAVVNQTGTLTATSMTQDASGQIVLRASGHVTVGGTLDASSNSGSGGSIDVRGDNVLVQDRAQLLANVTGQGNGGRIVVLAENAATVKGQLSVRGGSQGGDGGFVETSGHRVDLEGARINALAPLGKTGTWLIDPVDFTIAASGGSITGADLSSQLVNANVEIQSSSGNNGTAGDINVNDAVSWSANQLTLTAAHDININAVMTASGTSSLVLNAATTNGVDDGVYGGLVRTGFDGSGNFAGRVDFPGRSGTGFLTINGYGYTVLSGLGGEGDTSGLTLQGMNNGGSGGFYALGADIDASGTHTWNTGEGFVPIGQGEFSGAFNGLGHTIDSLTINRPSEDALGLFGRIYSSQISNVGLTRVNITGQDYVGGLVGYSYGFGRGSLFLSNSYVSGAVTGRNDVGGLVGEGAGLDHSHANAIVTGSGNEVGGLVGNNYGDVSNSYSTGDVNGSSTVGGLVGSNYYGTVSNSYSTSDVSGLSSVGGLVGSNNSGTVRNSYSSGNIVGTGDSVGGLIGHNDSSCGECGQATVTDSYFAGTVSGSSRVGGIVGFDDYY